MSSKPLLDFIAKYESSDNYNAVFSRIKNKPRNLTSWTIGQVLDWQDSIDPLYPSEAAGRYQIMEDTLREIYPKAGLKLTSLFDEKGQDALCRALLRRRGMEYYIIGKLTLESFCVNIAKEWASMPLVIPIRGKRVGQSYYGGDGLNKAHAPVDGLIAAVEALR